MKTLSTFIIFVIVFFSNSMYSQNQDMKKTERLIKSGRDSIIKKALKQMDEAIDVNEYKIQVMANKTSVIVYFQIPITYLSMNTVYNSNFAVDLIAGSSWSNIISNPPDYETDQDDIPNYSPTEETQKHIEFILNAIKNSDEIGSITIEDFSFEDSMIIRDNKAYYEIAMLSPHQESNYKIDKQSGKVFDSMHAHLIPPPNFEDENDVYKEIK